mgnify:FL=1
MDDIRVMKKINCFADLINDISFMFLLEDVAFADKGVQIDIHMLEN